MASDWAPDDMWWSLVRLLQPQPRPFSSTCTRFFGFDDVIADEQIVYIQRRRRRRQFLEVLPLLNKKSSKITKFWWGKIIYGSIDLIWHFTLYIFFYLFVITPNNNKFTESLWWILDPTFSFAYSPLNFCSFFLFFFYLDFMSF